MWNLPNALSLLRMLLALPVCIALWNNQTTIAVSLGVLAMLTDYLDGYFARKLNQISEMGKILDPLADKVMVISLIIILAVMQRIPLWLTVMIFSRDILILIGGIYLKKKLGYVVPSNQTGKWTVMFIALYIIYKALDLSFFEEYIVAFIAIMLVISFVQYLIRAIKLLRNA
jgi:CDP-diacylglycerol--glycerol-3-phosphate 3-phosphatidyltransferase